MIVCEREGEEVGEELATGGMVGGEEFGVELDPVDAGAVAAKRLDRAIGAGGEQRAAGWDGAERAGVGEAHGGRGAEVCDEWVGGDDLDRQEAPLLAPAGHVIGGRGVGFGGAADAGDERAEQAAEDEVAAADAEDREVTRASEFGQGGETLPVVLSPVGTDTAEDEGADIVLGDEAAIDRGVVLVEAGLSGDLLEQKRGLEAFAQMFAGMFGVGEDEWMGHIDEAEHWG